MIISKFKGYFLNVILIWLVVLLYKTLPYYISFIRAETIIIITFIAWAYTIIGLIYYILIPKQKITKTKGDLFFSLIKKALIKIIDFLSKTKSNIEITKKEKVALLFIIVKVFYLPIMINFVIANYFAIKSSFPNLIATNNLFSVSGFNTIIYPFLLATIFFIDTLWFAFGYATESKLLKNKIVSVEPTFLGWFVALICYPPFNTMFTNISNWYANDYVMFSNDIITFIARIIMILLLGIYVSATLALGTKASNLTHRGIVDRGPYRYIRHPAYISKNLVWWITLIPIISWPAIVSMGIWSVIYHLRSITEERHLGKDLVYKEYCKRVKYRYIPGVY